MHAITSAPKSQPPWLSTLCSPCDWRLDPNVDLVTLSLGTSSPLEMRLVPYSVSSIEISGRLGQCFDLTTHEGSSGVP